MRVFLWEKIPVDSDLSVVSLNGVSFKKNNIKKNFKDIQTTTIVIKYYQFSIKFKPLNENKNINMPYLIRGKNNMLIYRSTQTQRLWYFFSRRLPQTIKCNEHPTKPVMDFIFELSDKQSIQWSQWACETWCLRDQTTTTTTNVSVHSIDLKHKTEVTHD